MAVGRVVQKRVGGKPFDWSFCLADGKNDEDGYSSKVLVKVLVFVWQRGSGHVLGGYEATRSVYSISSGGEELWSPWIQSAAIVIWWLLTVLRSFSLDLQCKFHCYYCLRFCMFDQASEFRRRRCVLFLPDSGSEPWKRGIGNTCWLGALGPAQTSSRSS